MTTGAAFWLFMTVFLVCDTYLYSKGNNTFFWQYKTPEEKVLQMKIIEGTNESR